MASYQLTSGALVIRTTDGAIVPDDLRNADWQVYQNWLAAGNIPDPIPAPSPPTPAMLLAIALGSGVTATWSTSTTLNAGFAVDQQSQFQITAETVSILTNNTFTNGQASRRWPTVIGTFVTMTVAQFKAFATAVALYVDLAQDAYGTALAGQTPTWPSTNIAIAA